jgi:hypothetical protein
MLILSLQIAVVAVTFTDILTRPKMIFAGYGAWLDKIEPKYPFLAYPLGYCPVCFGGQIALWCFAYRLAVGLEPVAWALPVGVFFVSLTCLLCAVLSKGYARMNR